MEFILKPLFGGVLIGLASSVILFGLGRISGISGIFSSVLGLKLSKDDHWKYSFLAGLLFGGVLLKVLAPELFTYSLNSSFIEIILAGLLVGFGTRLGSGCTSGHGVCGLARMSSRSIVATLTFIAAGVITVYIRGII